MHIKVIGWHCVKTERTLENAQAAADGFKEKPTVYWIQDITNIIGMGRVVIPTLLVNDKFKVGGRIPSVYEIAMWIRSELGKENIAAQIERRGGRI